MGKIGLNDYLAAGHNVDDLLKLVRPDLPEVAGTAPLAPLAPKPRALADTLGVFRRWLHITDTAPVLAVAATIVANRATGDPEWLLVVGPPPGGKTEILSSAAGLPYIVKAATVTEAALLSGTASSERAANATGGLLRMVDDFGILLCKDFTSCCRRTGTQRDRQWPRCTTDRGTGRSALTADECSPGRANAG